MRNRIRHFNFPYFLLFSGATIFAIFLICLLTEQEIKENRLVETGSHAGPDNGLLHGMAMALAFLRQAGFFNPVEKRLSSRAIKAQSPVTLSKQLIPVPDLRYAFLKKDLIATIQIEKDDALTKKKIDLSKEAFVDLIISVMKQDLVFREMFNFVKDHITFCIDFTGKRVGYVFIPEEQTLYFLDPLHEMGYSESLEGIIKQQTYNAFRSILRSIKQPSPAPLPLIPFYPDSDQEFEHYEHLFNLGLERIQDIMEKYEHRNERTKPYLRKISKDFFLNYKPIERTRTIEEPFLEKFQEIRETLRQPGIKFAKIKIQEPFEQREIFITKAGVSQKDGKPYIKYRYAPNPQLKIQAFLTDWKISFTWNTLRYGTEHSTAISKVIYNNLTSEIFGWPKELREFLFPELMAYQYQQLAMAHEHAAEIKQLSLRM